jgi:hypothetical protein
MKRVCLMALMAIAGIWGCVPSIHGIASKDTIVWDDGLLGRWGDPNKADDPNAEVWQFAKGDEDGRYIFTHRDDEGKTATFDAYLVQLGEKLFLDIYLTDAGCKEMNTMAQVHLMPVHTFMIVDEIGEKLRLRWMNPDSVRELLKGQPELVKHEVRGEDEKEVILTAGTAELQQFVVQYAEKIFDDKDGSGLDRLQ